jgi:hypothetical protein
MEQLSQILKDATAAISAEYFRLPIHGADPVYRERVYCYELYHQMRLRWPPDCVYRLNGEVDKIGHPYFQDGARPKPDLLVHQPGHGNNHAIIEVKSSDAAAEGIRKDLRTLSRFENEFGYKRAIYVVYGDHPDGVLARVQEYSAAVEHLAPIELWLHEVCSPPLQSQSETLSDERLTEPCPGHRI